MDKPLETQPCGGPALSVLRRYDTGELATTESVPVKAHVDGCDACRAVLREFDAERQAVRFAVPLAALEARAFPEKKPFWRQAWMYLALPLAGAAAAIALVPRAPAVEDSPIRIKSAPVELDYLVRTTDGSRLGHDDEPLKAGDMIRLRYKNHEKHSKYVLIVGVDADGKVFPYYAEGDRSAPALDGLNLLSNAVTLDADPRPERIFALFSNDPIAVDEVRPAAHDALGAAHGDITRVKTLPVQGAEQATVLLNKVH